MKKILLRLQNRKVALAVVTGILLILVNQGVIDSNVSDRVLTTVNAILGIGVAIGVFSNPESHVE